jgi:hypothetical protein
MVDKASPEIPKFNTGLSPLGYQIQGSEQPDVQEYTDALENYQAALAARYAQPNMWKIAAAFAKPQLGGFMASLGSASEAMGENVEQQKGMMLPMFQIRSQIAQNKIAMSQQAKATNAFNEWQQSGKPMDEHTASYIVSMAPNSSVAAAAKDARESEKTNSSLRLQQQQLLSTQIQNKRNSLIDQKQNGQISQEKFNQEIQNLQELQERLTPIVAPTGTSDTASKPRAKDVGQTSGSMKQGEAPETKTETTSAQNTFENKNLPEVSAPSFLPEAGQFEPGRPDFSNFKIQNHYALPHNTPDNLLTAKERQENASVINIAKQVEEQPANQYKQLQEINNPITMGVLQGSIDGAEKAIKKNPELVDDVTNQVRKLGPLATAAQAGIVVSLYGNTASISIPVAEGAKGALSPAQQNFQDAFVNNLATLSYYSLKARNITPENAGAEKFKQLLLQETGILQGPQAIAHQVELNRIHVDHAIDLYKAINKAIPSALESRTPAPFYSIQEQHPLVKVEAGVYQGKLKEKNDSWEDQMKEARKKERARRP